MKLPRRRLSTRCLLVVSFALSFGLVALTKRHQDEVTRLKAEIAAHSRLINIDDSLWLDAKNNPTQSAGAR